MEKYQVRKTADSVNSSGRYSAKSYILASGFRRKIKIWLEDDTESVITDSVIDRIVKIADRRKWKKVIVEQTILGENVLTIRNIQQVGRDYEPFTVVATRLLSSIFE